MREEKRRETREDLLPKIAKEVEQDGILGGMENSFQRKIGGQKATDQV